MTVPGAASRDAGWFLVEEHDDDGCTWWVSLNDGWDPREHRALPFKTADNPWRWFALLRMGLGGLVGVA